MGNWRTVHIIGTCPKDQVEALKEACEYGASKPISERNYDNFHCLSMSNGLYGLGFWVQEKIDASGNLAERDYSIENVAEQLTKLSLVAPGLSVKVHCGGDWESHECQNTLVLKDGQVEILEPEVTHIRGASEDEMLGRFMKTMFR